MNRRATVCLLGLLLPAPVAAQIAVTTADGWTFTFAGNVGAFYVYEHEAGTGTVATPGALVGAGHEGSAIRSGYLPAFAVLDAKGQENGLRLGVHFGFAPQIQTTSADSGAPTGRVDMRQAYLTVGGGWGKILAGREVGVFARQNLLNDMTIFGVGATGGNFGAPGPGATTLGHSGYGYIYPGFNAQLTYSTPAERPVQLTAGIFDPTPNNGLTELALPRLEAELALRRAGQLAWVSALVQRERDPALGQSATAWGASGGVRLATGGAAALLSGYAGRGLGATELFRDGRTADPAGTALRGAFGYLAQATLTPGAGRLTLGVSYGESRLSSAGGETAFRTTNRAITAGAYLQLTRSLRTSAETTVAWSDDTDPATRANRSAAGAAGLMLFF